MLSKAENTPYLNEVSLSGAAGPDTAPPTVDVTAVVIEGTAFDDVSSVTVTVGGTEVPVVADAFFAEVLLSLPVTIQVVASDASDNTTTVVLDVSY